LAVLGWLKRVFRGGEKSGWAATRGSIVQSAMSRREKAEAISYAVNLSGLVKCEPDAMAFYESAFADHPERFLTYKELRKQGDLLDPVALKALGLRSNVKLSKQLLATLNEAGANDPINSANVIGLTISTALCTSRDLENFKSTGVNDAVFCASNMAAGPCGAAAKMDRNSVRVSNAPLLPLGSCSHPDQCSCRYLASFAVDSA